ncbi:UvrD-helicase domain-containing protein [Cellulosilyticum sp. ST5]|uniref:UvrD-helicase domain-containing protein n=1 Tax=Cellulosilyticum sp. ST5 TaxID=3055805 RepID=UPI003977C283
MNKSNVRIKSNIYTINKDKYSDFVFFGKVRGAKAIKALAIPATSDYSGNELQKQQIKKSIPCAILSRHRDEITNGIVKKGNEFVWEDRCDFTKCPCPCTEYAKDKSIGDYKVPRVITLKRSEKQEKIENNKPSLLNTYDEPEISESISTIKEIRKEVVIVSRTNDVIVHNENSIENIVGRELSSSRDTLAVTADTCVKNNIGAFKSIEQEEIIKAPADKSFLIDAPPGTGKTYSLIEKVKYLINEEKIDPQEILVLSFSRAAVKEIRGRVFTDSDDELIYVQDGIRTIDSFATLLLETYKQELGIDEVKGTYDERIILSTALMNKCSDISEHISYFIVDEIQDAIGIRGEFLLELLKNLNCGFTFFGDIYQSINGYQLKNGVQKDHSLTSINFRTEVINRYKDKLVTGEFLKNYRQCESLAMSSNSFRGHLKANDANKCRSLMDTLSEDDNNCIGDMEDFVGDINNTYCFLCRRNIEALKVSKYLRVSNIKHNLLIPQDKSLLPEWLARVLAGYRTSSINRRQFVELLNNTNEQDKADYYYDILLRFMDLDREVIRIDELLLRLSLEAYKFNFLYQEEQEESNVTVSTIHKAKGREFDVVIMNRQGIKNGMRENEDEECSEELRIFYVGMTRPKKKLYFHTTDIKMPRWKKGNRERIVRKNRNRFELRELEMKCSNDVNIESFVGEHIAAISGESVQQLQEYIKNSINKDDELTLRKYLENGDITYLIYHNSHVIGQVSDEFMSDLQAILHDTYREEDIKKYYPKAFKDVFVRQKASYIKLEGVGEYKIWVGISMVGIARIDNY